MLPADDHLAAITHRYGADDTLRRSVATNRALLDALPDVLLRIGANGRLVNYKAAADDPLLVPQPEWLGQPLAALLGADAARLLEEGVARALAHGTTQRVELPLTLAGQAREYEARIVATEPGEALAIVRDLSERVAVERATIAAIATVAHELRTPLTAIRGALGLLLRGLGGELPSAGRALITIANANAGRVLRLVHDLLDSEKAASGTMVLERTPHDLMPLVDEAIATNQTYGAQFEVRFVLANTLPGVQVHVDGDRLIQVLTNLLANAARFSPPGAAVEVGLAREGDRVRISVRDHGPGIPESFQPRVFQKFAQAPGPGRRARSGTGLGLSISKAIVEELGGEIGFQSIPGCGALFFVDLPVWGDAAVAVGEG
jgi:signal transduction histidine kinase